MGLTDLGDRAAAGEISGHAPVADTGDLGDQAGADHEARAAIEVEAGRARIDDRADAEDDVGIGLLQFARDLAEQVAGEVAAIGELDHRRAAAGAGADDVQADLRIRMVEDRGHALGLQGGQDGEAVVAHGQISSAGRSGSPPCLSHPPHAGKAPGRAGMELCVSRAGVTGQGALRLAPQRSQNSRPVLLRSGRQRWRRQRSCRIRREKVRNIKLNRTQRTARISDRTPAITTIRRCRQALNQAVR